jgi:hypothetical protein
MPKHVFTHPELQSKLLWGARSDGMSPAKTVSHLINVAHKGGVTLRDKHKKPHITYTEVPLLDAANNDISLVEAAMEAVHAAMGERGANVLVVCFAGRNRSGAVIAAYLEREATWRLCLYNTITFLKRKTVDSCQNLPLIALCLNSHPRELVFSEPYHSGHVFTVWESVSPDFRKVLESDQALREPLALAIGVKATITTRDLANMLKLSWVTCTLQRSIIMFLINAGCNKTLHD